jgi:hypothetical protein
MPLSSLQGRIHGVSRKALPAPALPRVIEKSRIASITMNKLTVLVCGESSPADQQNLYGGIAKDGRGDPHPE